MVDVKSLIRKYNTLSNNISSSSAEHPVPVSVPILADRNEEIEQRRMRNEEIEQRRIRNEEIEQRRIAQNERFRNDMHQRRMSSSHRLRMSRLQENSQSNPDSAERILEIRNQNNISEPVELVSRRLQEELVNSDELVARNLQEELDREMTENTSHTPIVDALENRRQQRIDPVDRNSRPPTRVRPLSSSRAELNRNNDRIPNPDLDISAPRTSGHHRPRQLVRTEFLTISSAPRRSQHRAVPFREVMINQTYVNGVLMNNDGVHITNGANVMRITNGASNNFIIDNGSISINNVNSNNVNNVNSNNGNMLHSRLRDNSDRRLGDISQTSETSRYFLRQVRRDFLRHVPNSHGDNYEQWPINSDGYIRDAPVCKEKASKEDLDSMTTYKFGTIQNDVSESDTSCVICRDDYDTNSTLCSLACFHKFHTFCIKRWLINEKNECPICRKPHFK